MYIWHSSAISYLKKLNNSKYDLLATIINKLDRKEHYIDLLLSLDDSNLKRYFLIDSSSPKLDSSYFKQTYNNSFGETTDDYMLIQKAIQNGYTIVIYPPALQRYNTKNIKTITIFNIFLLLYNNTKIDKNFITQIYQKHTSIFGNNNLALNNNSEFSQIRNIVNLNDYI